MTVGVERKMARSYILKIELNPDIPCSECGHVGSLEFHGYYLCGKCARIFIIENTRDINWDDWIDSKKIY